MYTQEITRKTFSVIKEKVLGRQGNEIGFIKAKGYENWKSSKTPCGNAKLMKPVLLRIRIHAILRTRMTVRWNSEDFEKWLKERKGVRERKRFKLNENICNFFKMTHGIKENGNLSTFEVISWTSSHTALIKKIQLLKCLFKKLSWTTDGTSYYRGRLRALWLSSSASNYVKLSCNSYYARTYIEKNLRFLNHKSG